MTASATIAANRLPRLVIAAIFAVGAILALTGVLRPAPARAADVVIVDVTGFAYVPPTITIQVGDTIQWNNADPVDHTATTTSGPASFDVYLAAGAWGSHTFTVAGVYDYYCIPHPTMVARVVVEPAPTTPGAPGGGSVPDVAMAPPAGAAAPLLVALALAGLLAVAAVDVRRRRRHATAGDDVG